jgi:DNA-binding MurR/RpiR family transcriptional regulator
MLRSRSSGADGVARPNRETQNPEDPFAARLHAAEGSLSPAARRVIRFIDRNRAATLASSAAELAARIGTSDATVVRAVQAAGFDGLPDLKQTLAAILDVRSSPVDHMRRTLGDLGESTENAIDLVFEAHREALAALQSPVARTKIATAVSILHEADRIVAFAIGPSAPLARYAAFVLGRSGRSAQVLDASGIGLADQLLGLRDGDALLALAYGPAYPEITSVFVETRRLDLPVVLITDSLEPKLADRADVVIPVPRGRAERVALHGATLVVLEAIVLALAASDRQRAMTSLERLDDLRGMLGGTRRDRG